MPPKDPHVTTTTGTNWKGHMTPTSTKTSHASKPIRLSRQRQRHSMDTNHPKTKKPTHQRNQQPRHENVDVPSAPPLPPREPTSCIGRSRNWICGGQKFNPKTHAKNTANPHMVCNGFTRVDMRAYADANRNATKSTRMEPSARQRIYGPYVAQKFQMQRKQK